MTSKGRASSEALWTTVVAVLALAGFGWAHWHTPQCGFVSDDYHLFAMSHSPSPYHILRTLVLDKGDPTYFRPLIIISSMVDGYLWGYRPAGFHFSNLLIHLANSILMYLLGICLLGNRRGAVVASAFFLIFPLQPEAVTWICGRCDLLPTLFCLSSMLFYWRYRDAGGRPYLLVLCVASGILGILSKELAVSFPLMLLVMELVFFRGAKEKGGKPGSRAAFLLLTIIPLYFCMRWFLLGEVRAALLAVLEQGIPDRSPFLVIGGLISHVLLNTTVRPLRTIVNPFNTYEVSTSWLPVLYGLMGLVLLVLGVRSGTYRNRAAVFGAVGFAVSLLPVAPIFNVGPDLQNARFLYAPSLFVCLYLGNLVSAKPGHEATGGYSFVRSVVVLVLGLAMTLGLRQNNQAWIEAGGAAERILAAFTAISPQVHAPSKVLIEGLPDNHHGAYVFRNGIAQAVNLYQGSLPPYRYVPDKNKFIYELSYMTEILPLKVVTPEMLNQWASLHPVLAALRFDLPSWITPDPAAYDHFLRWDAASGRFDVRR